MSRLVGLVPAAGLGTRLGRSGAKELTPLDGDSLLCHFVLEAMRRASICRVVIVVSRRKQAVRDALGDGSAFGLEIEYVEQNEPRGLPHAISCARPLLADDDVVFAMPDTVFFPDDALAVVARERACHGADVLLGVFPTGEATRLAPVEFTAVGEVRALYDKPASTRLHNTWGVLAWSARFTSFCAEHEARRMRAGEGNLTSVMSSAQRSGFSLRAHWFAGGAFRDAGTLRGLASARALLRVRRSETSGEQGPPVGLLGKLVPPV